MSKPLSVSSVKKLDFRPSEIGEVGGLRISRRLQIFDKSSSIRFLIDTGSDVSIIPASKIEKTREPSPFLLHAANGTKIRTYGSKFVSVDLGLRRKFSWNFLQADVTSAIIGADFLAHFGLLVDLGNRRLIDGGTKLHTVCGLSKSSVYGVTTIAKDHPFRDLLVEFREITAPPTMRTENDICSTFRVSQKIFGTLVAKTILLQTHYPESTPSQLLQQWILNYYRKRSMTIQNYRSYLLIELHQ
ncbi:uncharacterized protein LOC121592523 [Anopheles merus]|uniref:uncharacterized protein LOC121592523 n=1 Tax=Anopheles merus TaxID=30066 RepID=UPI001BE47A8A|nr:uncharacterized protein LOC121592523 [Anopheles merus]